MKLHSEHIFRRIRNTFEFLPRITLCFDESDHWVTWMLSIAWGTFEYEYILNYFKGEKSE